MEFNKHTEYGRQTQADVISSFEALRKPLLSQLSNASTCVFVAGMSPVNHYNWDYWAVILSDPTAAIKVCLLSSCSSLEVETEACCVVICTACLRHFMARLCS